MSTDKNQNIARRTASGSIYSISASIITIILGFVRTTLVLRILFPEDVGLSASALLYVNLIFLIFTFGFDAAYIHRPQVDESVRRTYFTLRFVSGLLAGLATILFIPLITNFFPEYQLLGWVMFGYTTIYILRAFTFPQVTMLNKKMAFRQLTTIDVISSILMTITAPTLAWFGWGVWSLVAEQFIGTFGRTLLIVFYYRPWSIRFGWNRELAHWFWDYGKRIWHISNLSFLINSFDDWYTVTFLGLNAAGFYAKAYEYAGYPRRVIANPLLSVFYPTFSHLQDDRPRLSRAFFRATSLMVRGGVLLSLLLIFTAPEFILLLVGEKWAPMTATFQLMIIYTLLDPLNNAAKNLLAATGHPGMVLRARIFQAIVFVPAVLLLGHYFNINGVAIAANIMILMGAIWLFAKTRVVVDYSQRALWFWPLFSMAVTAVLVLALNPLWSQVASWLAFLGKLGFITAVYGILLWLTEREQLRHGREMIWGIIAPMLTERRKILTKRHRKSE